MARQIDKSMRQKGELTLIMNNYKDLETQKKYQKDVIESMHASL